IYLPQKLFITGLSESFIRPGITYLPDRSTDLVSLSIRGARESMSPMAVILPSRQATAPKKGFSPTLLYMVQLYTTRSAFAVFLNRPTGTHLHDMVMVHLFYHKKQ